MTTFWRGLSVSLGFVAAAGSQAQSIHAVTPILEGHSVGGVTLDAIGNLYVADFGEQVFKITPEGELSSFVSGLYGASGNAVDRHGFLLQSNFYDHSVVRIDRGGTVVARYTTGLLGPVGIAVDSGKDAAFVADCQANALIRIGSDGEIAVFATSPLFHCPNGVAFGPGAHLFVTNFRDNAMLDVAPDGTVKLFAHVSSHGLGHLCLKDGLFYVTAYGSHEVYTVSTTGNVRRLIGTGERGVVDGSVESARLSFPNGIACDPYHERIFINEYVGEDSESLPRRAVVRMIDLGQKK